ncbi:1-deoxy-D-xylulose-5-phosphate synthase [Erysipelothrix sp. HDW6C]|uniref:1-deoxy-D-xylulose-5-phosphate synthase N-terminal domain-containing protein n=1 Tax=Erysipelothrix sp. HDW6C TaxID=2714930 RepID=UPI00140BDA74|nr:1-deoxy-D-xylulose-5-phosphate synthase N-terminal domain-containing protein [Erysipelothrix sp. HDW6C]QIK70055.1 1-deoxy-D-xylulose-5-phosphate synthase [Erysipelothrix sp. HDW6C]
MFNQFEKPNTLRELKVPEISKLSDQIAEYLTADTRFDVETIIKNINVLETTLALHYVFDLRTDRVIFDGGSQVMVHKILTGRADELSLRTNIPLTLDTSNLYDAYQGGDIGEGLGVALAYALESNERVIIMLDDHALNYGVTYESLVQISKNKPNLTIIMIDEQQSLLRHYTSIDSLVKSVRISKTYVGLKKDMKSVLDSNPISRPIFNTLVKMRDALKETVLEPTIFTQFGIDYHGPIDGQNLPDLIKVLTLAKNFKGPNLIHVQTRLRKNARRKLEFPAFKTDTTLPDNFKTHHEMFDQVLVGKRNPKMMLLVDALNFGDYFREFEEAYPNNYKVTTGSTESLITMAAGYARMGFHVVLALASTRIIDATSQLRHQFVIPKLPLTILVRKTGLSSSGNAYEQGIYDIAPLSSMANVFMASDINESYALLDTIIESPGINVLRYQNTPEAYEFSSPNVSLAWSVVKPIREETNGVVLTFGSAVNQFAKRIESNALNISLVNCRHINAIDTELLVTLNELKLPVLIYNIESDSNELYANAQRACYELNLKDLQLIRCDLEGIDLNLPTKELKRVHHIHIDDALNLLLER